MTRNHFILRIHVAFLRRLFLFLPAAGANPGAATITYRRVFKNSSPEFIEIKVSEDGKSTFDIRRLDDDADPQAV